MDFGFRRNGGGKWFLPFAERRNEAQAEHATSRAIIDATGTNRSAGLPARLAPDRNRGLIIACGRIGDDERGTALLLRLVALVGAQPRVLIVAASEGVEDPDTDFE